MREVQTVFSEYASTPAWPSKGFTISDLASLSQIITLMH